MQKLGATPGLAMRQVEAAHGCAACHYASAVQSLVADCALLAGVVRLRGPQAAVELVTHELPPPERWRSYSKLCVDGAPIELCLHLEQKPRAPSVSLDAGPYGAALPARIKRAFEVAVAVLPELGPVLVQPQTALMDPKLLQMVRAVWLGLSLEPRPSLRFYLSVCEPGAVDRQLAALGRLTRAFHIEPPQMDLLEELAATGILRSCAFDVSSQGVIGIKASFALALADPERVSAVARSCGIDPELLMHYITRLLRRGQSWRDRRCGIGIAIANPGGDADGVQAMTLYHPVQPYFGSDQTIRAAVISIIELFGWDPITFAALSQRVQDDIDGCAFQLAGFSLRRNGATGLSVYAGTGHVAR